MKGYFSQLARHTGLRFTSAAHPTSPASGTPRPAPASPLHVDEVTFVPASPAVSAHATSDEQTSSAAVPENARIAETRHTTPNPEPSQTTRLTESDTRRFFPEAFGHDVHESPLANDSNEGSGSLADAHTTLQRVTTEHQSPSRQRNAERDLVSTKPADNNLQFERVVTFATPDQDHQTKAEPPPPAANDLDPSDPLEREVLVRQYLREVRAWVAAPPTPIPDIPENALPQESEAGEWQPEHVTTFASDRALLNSSPQPAQPDRLDVHETSLSIGSITVVIEDPKPNVMTIAPAPPAPVAQPQPQPEPTSLSRYYLQRW